MIRIIFCIFLIYSHVTYASQSCNTLLSVNNLQRQNNLSDQNATNDFIAYLAALLENRVIKEDIEILRFIESLANGKVINPILEEEALINSTSYIHREEINKYIQTTNLDSKKLLRWAESVVTEKKRVEEKREETLIETKEINQKIEFNKVLSGDFMMGGDEKVFVKITKDFEMMSTVITQRHWAMIMGSNPSKFYKGEHTADIDINGKKITMQPDNPVENISWDDVQEFIKRLNELAKNDAPIIKEFIIDHKKGEQYRLPTEAEWEFVITGRGQINSIYHFGNNKDDLKNYGWYKDNSKTSAYPNGTTHPVAQLAPLVVDGYEFYDMHGNVWEWTSDLWYAELFGGVDPQGPKSGFYHVVRGGSCSYYEDGLRSYLRSGLKVDYYSVVGFRLVRIRP
ncbi:MAG: hypothetical protein A2Z20_03505 [Bdellovibrionales bacterium RBG_16_40_8]|nr:MAG: hypothetical protein A2Z20_03505 [Bdellovibrionales bacterium RBG_16_40_8]